MTPTTKAGRDWESVRNWLGLDVWMMLGRDSMKYPGWSADVWAEMMAAVKARAAEAEALRATLERIRDFEATAPIDEWAEAAAFTAVQDIARAALANPAPAAEPVIGSWAPGEHGEHHDDDD